MSLDPIHNALAAGFQTSSIKKIAQRDERSGGYRQPHQDAPPKKKQDELELHAVADEEAAQQTVVHIQKPVLPTEGLDLSA